MLCFKRCNFIRTHSPEEEAMLWEAYHVKDNSRLGCQIHITEDLEGLEIEIAPEQ
jgi:ferredoxin